MSCAAHGTTAEPCRYCEWAASGEPHKAEAARWRADRVAGIERPEPTVVRAAPPKPRKSKVKLPAWLLYVQSCVYRECMSGCQGTVCHWRSGKPEPNHKFVHAGDCAACLGVVVPKRS